MLPERGEGCRCKGKTSVSPTKPQHYYGIYVRTMKSIENKVAKTVLERVPNYIEVDWTEIHNMFIYLIYIIIITILMTDVYNLYLFICT